MLRICLDVVNNQWSLVFKKVIYSNFNDRQLKLACSQEFCNYITKHTKCFLYLQIKTKILTNNYIQQFYIICNDPDGAQIFPPTRSLVRTVQNYGGCVSPPRIMS